MKLEKFVMLVLNKGKKFGNSVGNTSFGTYKELAKLTEFVDYGCKFDSHGRCIRYKRASANRPTMCCCVGCFNAIGYLYHFPTGSWTYGSEDKFKELKVYARHFSEKIVKSLDNGNRPIGFWRPDSGCVLPRSYRSRVCLGYRCNKENESEWEKKLFLLLNTSITFPVIIRGKEYDSYTLAKGMAEWYKELNDKNNSK